MTSWVRGQGSGYGLVHGAAVWFTCLVSNSSPNQVDCLLLSSISCQYLFNGEDTWTTSLASQTLTRSVESLACETTGRLPGITSSILCQTIFLKCKRLK